MNVTSHQTEDITSCRTESGTGCRTEGATSCRDEDVRQRDNRLREAIAQKTRAEQKQTRLGAHLKYP